MREDSGRVDDAIELVFEKKGALLATPDRLKTSGPARTPGIKSVKPSFIAKIESNEEKRVGNESPYN